MSLIYYKYASNHDFRVLKFAESDVSLVNFKCELRRHESEKLGSLIDSFDLIIVDNETRKEFNDCDILATGQHVEVSRVPKSKKVLPVAIPNSILVDQSERRNRMPNSAMTSSDKDCFVAAPKKPISNAESCNNLTTRSVGFAQPVTIQENSMDIPVELKCPSCKGILRNAVVLPCCGNSTCESCACNCLPKGSKCTLCSLPSVDVSDVVSNNYLRRAVTSFLDETNCSPVQVKQDKKLSSSVSSPSILDFPHLADGVSHVLASQNPVSLPCNLSLFSSSVSFLQEKTLSFYENIPVTLDMDVTSRECEIPESGMNCDLDFNHPFREECPLVNENNSPASLSSADDMASTVELFPSSDCTAECDAPHLSPSLSADNEANIKYNGCEDSLTSYKTGDSLMRKGDVVHMDITVPCKDSDEVFKDICVTESDRITSDGDLSLVEKDLCATNKELLATEIEQNGKDIGEDCKDVITSAAESKNADGVGTGMPLEKTGQDYAIVSEIDSAVPAGGYFPPSGVGYENSSAGGYYQMSGGQIYPGYIPSPYNNQQWIYAPGPYGQTAYPMMYPGIPPAPFPNQSLINIPPSGLHPPIGYQHQMSEKEFYDRQRRMREVGGRYSGSRGIKRHYGDSHARSPPSSKSKYGRYDNKSRDQYSSREGSYFRSQRHHEKDNEWKRKHDMASRSSTHSRSYHEKSSRHHSRSHSRHQSDIKQQRSRSRDSRRSSKARSISRDSICEKLTSKESNGSLNVNNVDKHDNDKRSKTKKQTHHKNHKSISPVGHKKRDSKENSDLSSAELDGCDNYKEFIKKKSDDSDKRRRSSGRDKKHKSYSRSESPSPNERFRDRLEEGRKTKPEEHNGYSDTKTKNKKNAKRSNSRSHYEDRSQDLRKRSCSEDKLDKKLLSKKVSDEVDSKKTYLRSNQDSKKKYKRQKSVDEKERSASRDDITGKFVKEKSYKRDFKKSLSNSSDEADSKKTYLSSKQQSKNHKKYHARGRSDEREPEVSDEMNHSPVEDCKKTSKSNRKHKYRDMSTSSSNDDLKSDADKQNSYRGKKRRRSQTPQDKYWSRPTEDSCDEKMSSKESDKLKNRQNGKEKLKTSGSKQHSDSHDRSQSRSKKYRSWSRDERTVNNGDLDSELDNYDSDKLKSKKKHKKEKQKQN